MGRQAGRQAGAGDSMGSCRANHLVTESNSLQKREPHQPSCLGKTSERLLLFGHNLEKLVRPSQRTIDILAKFHVERPSASAGP